MVKKPSCTPLLPFREPSDVPGKLRHTDLSLAALLSRRVGRRVEVVFGRSRRVPVKLRRYGPVYRLRLHSFFAGVPDDVLDALSLWVAQGKRCQSARRQLQDWIRAELDRLPRPARHSRPELPRGLVHDLSELAAELCAGPWLPDLRELPRLAWGGSGRARYSLQLGVYDPDTHTVRIHRVLDNASVPRWFVRSILFHELLHAAIPSRRDADGRWVKHGPDFRRRERAFEDYDRARVWLDANIDRLLLAARRLGRR